MPEIKEIIWDADNTIWNWVHYAAKAYPAMAKAIAEETGIPEEDVAAGMKTYYSEVGSMESPRLIQGLNQMGFFKRARKKPVDLTYLRKYVMRIFQRHRSKNFKLYEGISDVMKKAHEHGITNRILTDAPLPQATMRIKKSNLEPYVTSIHAVKVHEIVEKLPPEIEQAIKNGKYDIDCFTEELEVEKPDTRLEHILEIVAETHSEIRRYIRDHVAIVGDNERKDMELSRLYQCLGVYAQYGLPEPQEIKILGRFAPERVARKNSPARNGKPLSGNIVVIENRRDIRQKMMEAFGLRT